jgi:hypothetical protein
VPATVHVARHKARATFSIRTSVTHSGRHGTIEATLGRVHRRAPLKVTRTPHTCRTPALSALTLVHLAYVGDRPRATIRLTCAPTSAVRIALGSASTFLPVPKTVTVGAYYNSAALALVPRADQAGQYQAKITARLSRTTRSATITVNPGLSFVQIPPSSEPDSVSFVILFTGEVPAGGLTVKLASSNPAVTVPATYTFTQEGSVGGDVLGITVQTVAQNTPVTLSATLGTVTRRASVTLLPPFDSSDSATLSALNGPGPIYGQEFDLEYILSLSNPAPADGLTANFSSPSSDLQIQAPTGFVTGGFTDAFVDINTGDVTSPVHTELDATVDGVTATLPITIEPGLTTLTVPASVTGGDSFTATVSVAGNVDTDTTVALQSLDGVVTVPQTVVIPAGESSATFTATTVAVDSVIDVGLGATLGTTNVYSADVAVNPP